MAYVGDPIRIEDLLFTPEHSLISQSLNARMGATPTHGVGFGSVCALHRRRPAVVKGVAPAWSAENLREISAQVRTRLLFAHVRAATDTAVQRTNCHPFRHDNWLWMHNGIVAGLRE